MDDRGVCASAPPTLLGDRLVGTPYTLAQVVEALARGERLTGLSDAQVRLAEAAAERA
jgi:hypothetical protein